MNKEIACRESAVAFVDPLASQQPMSDFKSKFHTNQKFNHMHRRASNRSTTFNDHNTAKMIPNQRQILKNQTFARIVPTVISG